jgi:hypothetical protein
VAGGRAAVSAARRSDPDGPDGGTYAASGWFNWPGEGWANHVPARLLEESGD